MTREFSPDMEVLFYSFALAELQKLVVSRRIQKIYSPGSRLWTFDLGQTGYLVVHLAPSAFYFYISQTKPANPATPAAQVMWLRKRLCGRKISGLISAWPRRCLVFSLSGGEDCLVLDSKSGPGIQTGAEPAPVPNWPPLADLLASPQKNPYISKVFIQHLEQLDATAQNKLYQNIQAGTIKTFWLSSESSSPLCWPFSASARSFPSALQAAEACYASSARQSSLGIAEEEKGLKRRKKRLLRNLTKLDEDEKRLCGLVELKKHGELLKSVLYLYPAQTKKAGIVIERGAEQHCLSLDSRFTLRENMDVFFRRSKKGLRGLKFITERRAALQAELAALEKNGLALSVLPKKQKTGGRGKEKQKYAALAVYQLPAGWTVLRGKDAQANHRLLSQLASPFDLWLHAANGPGAHIILKRDFPDQEVDSPSLEQAACLAGVYSWQKQAARADVICALVRHVRKNKGAGLGQVVVDEVWASLRVPVNQEQIEQFRVD